MLSWRNPKGWSWKATLKRELVIIFQVVFSHWCSHASKDKLKKQANHKKKVHLIISGSQIIWVKNGFHYWWLVFTKLIIGLHIAIAELNWNRMTILYSNIANVSLQCAWPFSSITSMRLVHIVHAYRIMHDKWNFKIHSLPLLLVWLIDLVVVYEFVHELVNPSTLFNLYC